MAVVCSACGAPNPDGARFCNSCGVVLAAACPDCGGTLPAAGAACPHCVPGPDRHPQTPERKLATILFADLSGSTGLAERLDVERLQELMGSYFEAMRLEVEAVGGIVARFVGDALMAVFGVPAAHDDDPDRALEAALRMQRRLARLNEDLFTSGDTFAGVSSGLDMHIGVNTGEVLTTGARHPDLGSLAGDATNVAARLQEQAAPGQVLVSERTAAASSRFTFTEIGPMQLRGRIDPVRVYRLGDRAATRRTPRVSLTAPLVARDHELRLLDSLYERVVSEGRPHLVTIYGAAGVGKSRLAAEFVAQSVGFDPSPNVLRGRCLPYGEEVAFGALAELLRTAADVGDGDSAQVAAARVAALCADLDTAAPGEAARSAAALAYTAGISGDGETFAAYSPRQIQSEIRMAWRWFFTAMAQSRPIIAVIEDIHWADPALLDLLEDLADRMVAPVMFTCPARPLLAEARPGWGGGRRDFSGITLDPLAAQDSRRMVELLLSPGSIPGSAHRRIHRHAEGNPFFIEEIVRRLIDEGAIERSNGEWQLTGVIDAIDIPDTVQAVLAARIDLLDPAEKRALQCAAVIGRTFWTGPLGSLVGLDPEATGALLDGLEDRELVVSRLGSSLEGQREYRFKHVLTRDVAYSGLARRDRTALHLAVVDWMKATAGARSTELAGLLAHHLGQAYEGLRSQTGASPAAVERLRAETLHISLQASERARRRVALGEAKHFAGEARRIAAGRAEESLAAEAMGEAFFYGYEGDPAWRYLREAIDLRMSDPGLQGPDVGRLCARALELTCRWPGAMQSPPPEETVARYLDLGLEHAEPDGETACRLLTARGFWQHAYPNLGADSPPQLVTPEESLQSALRAAELARASNQPDLESAALDSVAGVYVAAGDYGRAAPPTARRLDLLESLTDVWEIGDTHAMNAWVSYHLGRYEPAFRYADTGFRRTVNEAPSLAIHCLRWRAVARYRLGDWDGVLTDVGAAQEILGDQRDQPADYVSPLFAAAALVAEIRGEHRSADRLLDLLGGIHRSERSEGAGPLPLSRWAEFVAPLLARRGRHDAARALIDHARWRRPARHDQLLEASCVVLAEAGDWEGLSAAARQARSHAAAAGTEALALAADAAEGRVALAGGDPAGACRLLGAAARGYAELDAQWDRAQTELILARAFVAAGRGPDAESILAGVLPRLEGLAAWRELEAARELAARAATDLRPDPRT